jgi:hypothetical protein
LSPWLFLRGATGSSKGKRKKGGKEMRIWAKDGLWVLSLRSLRRGQDRYPVDLPSIAEYLGLFVEELLSMIREGKEVHLESVELGRYVGV